MVWIEVRSVLIWVQTVCIGNQQVDDKKLNQQVYLLNYFITKTYIVGTPPPQGDGTLWRWIRK